MFYFLNRLFCILVFKLLFRIQAYGREHIPRKGGFILASNHVSFLDPIAVGIACPRQLNFMARHDLFSHRFFGWLIYSVGSFPVKRNTADRSALKEAIRRLEDGKGLLLFPEGRRAQESNTADGPQAGIGFLAAKAGVPVIPAFVKGTDKALPKGAKFIRPKKVSVYFGKQIEIKNGLSYLEIAQLAMAGIRQLEENS